MIGKGTWTGMHHTVSAYFIDSTAVLAVFGRLLLMSRFPSFPARQNPVPDLLPSSPPFQ